MRLTCNCVETEQNFRVFQSAYDTYNSSADYGLYEILTNKRTKRNCSGNITLRSDKISE